MSLLHDLCFACNLREKFRKFSAYSSGLQSRATDRTLPPVLLRPQEIFWENLVYLFLLWYNVAQRTSCFLFLLYE